MKKMIFMNDSPPPPPPPSSLSTFSSNFPGKTKGKGKKKKNIVGSVV